MTYQPTSSTFEVEARELAADEHHDLSRRLEEMEMDCEYTARDIYRWEVETGFQATAEGHFEQHRARFLERAREEFGVAA